jgi:hypothetical protein
VVLRAVKAQGGADALAKFQAGVVRYKGTFHLGDDLVSFDGVRTFQLPDRRRIETVSESRGRPFRYVETFDGDKGYVVLSGEVQSMAREQLAETREQLNEAAVASLTPLLGKGYALTLLGAAKVGDREAVGVRVSRKGRGDVDLFFDKKDGLLLQSVRRARDPLAEQEYTSETFYRDYRKVGDALTAHRTEVRRDGIVAVEAETTELKTEAKPDAAVFGKP